MLLETKQQIISAGNAYVNEKGITAKDFANICGINPSYLSHMLRGIFAVKGDGEDEPTEISDKWFNKLADAIGLNIGKFTLGTIVTEQFTEIVRLLEEAKKYGFVYTIIGDTGCGKTFTLNKYCVRCPQNTYRITVSSLHTLAGILDELCGVMGLKTGGRDNNKLRRIAEHCQKIRQAGGEPLIVIDEGENLKAGPLRMIKALYDAVVEYAGIVLIGTPELLRKLLHMKNRQDNGIPQLYRRLRAGIREIKAIDKSFSAFFEKHAVEKGLRKLLIERSDNYGELNDWLLPVAREAQEKNVPLTEDLFRIYHNIPRNVTAA